MKSFSRVSTIKQSITMDTGTEQNNHDIDISMNMDSTYFKYNEIKKIKMPQEVIDGAQ